MSSAAIVTAALCTASAALAENDGYFNVSGYRDNSGEIGFSLTQIGAYGELSIDVGGMGGLGYGNCIVNFKRDDSGAIIEQTAIIQKNSANCPEKVAFSTAKGEKDMLTLSFTEGGPLAGQSYDMFTVLRPVTEADAIKAPEGFNIIGATIGQTRAEIEAILTAEGYEANPQWSETQNYDGATRALTMYTKGKSHIADYEPADAISVTYTAVIDGTDFPERAAVMYRRWSIPPSAKLSVAALEKSLQEKHGAPSKISNSRYYDRKGTAQPEAYQFVCDEDIGLQSVGLNINGIGMSWSGDAQNIACGASVEIMVMESFEVAGLAQQLSVTLRKGDVAFEDFWNSWSLGEAKALQERFELQSGMNGEAPKL